jgi:NADH-quinone oxidoreductase subunit J
MLTTVVFYLFAAILLFAALQVITAKNPVYAVLYLVLAFFNSAVLWMLIDAEFLAISLVLIYVGAVMVLFLFVVMMLNINFEALRQGFWRHLPVAATVGVLMALELVLILTNSFAKVGFAKLPALAAGYSNVRELGLLLYTEYLLPFELASVILVVAIIAAIALTLRQRKQTKYQHPDEQVKVQRDERLRIVKMEAIVEAPAEPTIPAQDSPIRPS